MLLPGLDFIIHFACRKLNNDKLNPPQIKKTMMIEMVSVIKYFVIFCIWLFKLVKSSIPYHSLLILVIRAKNRCRVGPQHALNQIPASWARMGGAAVNV